MVVIGRRETRASWWWAVGASPLSALEHFTGRVNAETYGMGSPPISFRCGSRTSWPTRCATPPAERERMRRLVADLGGYYDYWATGSRVTLRSCWSTRGWRCNAAQAMRAGLRCGRLLRLSPAAVSSPPEGDGGIPPRAVEPDLERSGSASDSDTVVRDESVGPPGGRARPPLALRYYLGYPDDRSPGRRARNQGGRAHGGTGIPHARIWRGEFRRRDPPFCHPERSEGDIGIVMPPSLAQDDMGRERHSPIHGARKRPMSLPHNRTANTFPSTSSHVPTPSSSSSAAVASRT